MSEIQTNVISEIIGKIPIRVDQAEDRIEMHFDDGSTATWYHYQECCESVLIEDVVGKWEDLCGYPLLVAEERISHDHDEDTGSYEANTWTFYTFRCLNGSVDVRWHGNSNGFYSESVDFSFQRPE